MRMPTCSWLVGLKAKHLKDWPSSERGLWTRLRNAASLAYRLGSALKATNATSSPARASA